MSDFCFNAIRSPFHDNSPVGSIPPDTPGYQRDRHHFKARYHSVTSLPIPNRASWRRSASRTSGVLYSSMRYWGSVQTRRVRPQIFVSGGMVKRMRWIRLMPASAAVSITISVQLLLLKPNWSYFRCITYSWIN